MSQQKLPDGMRIDMTVYLTDGQMSAAISLGNFSVMPPLEIDKPVNVTSLLRSAGLDDGDDLTGWRVMTAAEIKEYREDNA